MVELNPGDQLYGDGDTSDLERGLFFIEFGIMVSFSSLQIYFDPCNTHLYPYRSRNQEN
jgi:hypothetical protein